MENMSNLITCPECFNNDTYRPWCNLCSGTGVVKALNENWWLKETLKEESQKDNVRKTYV
jgi:hypothetical protein